MQWIKKLIYILKGIFGMSMPTSFEEAVQSLQNFLTSEGRNPLDADEISYLCRFYLPWMGGIELAGLLWEYRFNVFFKKVLGLLPDGGIDELRSLAMEFYRKNMKPEDAAKEYRQRNYDRQQANKITQEDSPKISQDNQTSLS